ncbi:MAG: LysR family transcriptional regulator [Kofleriaceae bacterium]|nr:LysR family transcriptional regulator [Kofleriaceae bacterium]
MIDVRHVRTVLTLAEELHFGRAARRLHVVQSAVSQTLRAIEDELGVALFTRTRRSVALTAAGEAFCAHARRALTDLEDARRAARHAADGLTGRLVLRFTLMTALTVVPRALARFRREAPGVAVEIHQQGTAAQLDELHAGRADGGFVTYLHAIDEPLALACVRREPLMALLPARHPLARRREVRLADLATQPLIALDRRAEPRIWDDFRAGCQHAGFAPEIAFEVDQTETLLAFVAAGLGISFAPDHIGMLRFPGVVRRPVTPRIPSGTCMVWNRERLSPAAARFLNLVRAMA